MIIVNLKGGLGNQMFQYALGRRLALKNNDELKLETDGLERANAVGDIYRPFSLAHFSVAAETASSEEVRRLKYPYGIISKGWRFVRAKFLRQVNKFYDERVLSWTGDIFLDGYWQSPRYFDDIRDTLLADFTLKAGFSAPGAVYEKEMRETASVSVHIRRGDYAASERVQREFGICSPAYYQAAIEHITEQTAAPTFFVFSDDPDWVREHLSFPGRVTYVSGTGLTDAEELMLMSTSRHNIIANSTFSWWGAWLNQNPAKIVVAPTPWFDRNPYDPSLLPNSWILLEKSKTP